MVKWLFSQWEHLNSRKASIYAGIFFIGQGPAFSSRNVEQVFVLISDPKRRPASKGFSVKRSTPVTAQDLIREEQSRVRVRLVKVVKTRLSKQVLFFMLVINHQTSGTITWELRYTVCSILLWLWVLVDRVEMLGRVGTLGWVSDGHWMQGTLKGKYHCTVDFLFDSFRNACLCLVHWIFYLTDAHF